MRPLGRRAAPLGVVEKERGRGEPFPGGGPPLAGQRLAERLPRLRPFAPPQARLPAADGVLGVGPLRRGFRHLSHGSDGMAEEIIAS